MSKTDCDGRPYLAATISTNAKGASRTCLAVTEVERFAAEHITLADLAAERGAWDRALKKQLEQRGVQTILPQSMLTACVYRRADV